MKIFEKFLTQYNEYKNSLNSQNVNDLKQEVVYSKEELEKMQKDLISLIDLSHKILLNDTHFPSYELKNEIKKLHIRANEPMKVAITGQFSSGKSTFLNALLAKNLLPTGVTPVTSKVNYIRYAKEVKLQIKYKDGREEEHPVENIKKFTDQREKVEEIEYLTIFSPLEILKDIVFVDTPGLNSQSEFDTETTQKVLKEVDGIIWLTLIDNAGKRSEEKTLEEYLDAYQNKSLCVLNQKDKFDNLEEIEESLNYVSNKFDKYFSKVVAISARQALEARSHDEESLTKDLMENFIKEIKKELEKDLHKDNFDFFKNSYTKFHSSIKNIEKMDLLENTHLMEESNIKTVLDFIQNEIQPKAIESKNFAIRLDLKCICNSLIEQNKNFIKIFGDFATILEDFDLFVKERIANYKINYEKEMKKSYNKIEIMIDTIASEIYKNIVEEERLRYFEDKVGLFGKTAIVNETYNFYRIDIGRIINTLFEDKMVVKKLYNDYRVNINESMSSINSDLIDLYKEILGRISILQKNYENYTKKNAINSDLKCDNIKKFASKTYETLLKNYSDEILISMGKIEAEFRHLKIFVKANYKSATFKTIQLLENERERARISYEKNPKQFPFTHPSIKEITYNLREDFEMDELKKNMIGQNSFLSKRFEIIKETFHVTKMEKVDMLSELQEPYIANLEEIEKFVNNNL